MREDILREVTARLTKDYNLRERGGFLREGKCPQCNDKKALWTPAGHPWVLRCGRVEKCGWEGETKSLYPEIFDDWSKRYKATKQNPNAAADAYLIAARGLDIAPLKGAYTQEWYQDPELNIGSATVRFPMPGGGYWQRLIDQAHRFGDKKATFSYGGGIAGRSGPIPATPSKRWPAPRKSGSRKASSTPSPCGRTTSSPCRPCPATTTPSSSWPICAKPLAMIPKPGPVRA